MRRIERRYRDGTLVLETEYLTDEGTVAVVDCIPVCSTTPDLIRMVIGRRGHVTMDPELRIRFDYGSLTPWVQCADGLRVLRAIGGPDSLCLHAEVPLRATNSSASDRFAVAAGQRVPFLLSWAPFTRAPVARHRRQAGHRADGELVARVVGPQHP